MLSHEAVELRRLSNFDETSDLESQAPQSAHREVRVCWSCKRVGKEFVALIAGPTITLGGLFTCYSLGATYDSFGEFFSNIMEHNQNSGGYLYNFMAGGVVRLTSWFGKGVGTSADKMSGCALKYVIKSASMAGALVTITAISSKVNEALDPESPMTPVYTTYLVGDGFEFLSKMYEAGFVGVLNKLGCGLFRPVSRRDADANPDPRPLLSFVT